MSTQTAHTAQTKLTLQQHEQTAVVRNSELVQPTTVCQRVLRASDEELDCAGSDVLGLLVAEQQEKCSEKKFAKKSSL